MIYVLSERGLPLMPTNRNSMVRKILESGEAVIIKHKPFTIQLLKPSTEFVENNHMGIDSGYKFIGASVVSDKKELFSAEVEQRMDIPSLIEIRSKHRRAKRSRLKYREPRYNNRKKGICMLEQNDKVLLLKDVKNTSFKKHDIVFFSHKENDFHVFRNENQEYFNINKKIKNSFEKFGKWYPPSIQHKIDTHMKIIEESIKILPMYSITIEIAAFDIQKIMNPDIAGIQYQEGEQLGFYNVREYVLHRDGHECQNPNCKNKDKNKILQIHHILYREHGGTDRPANLIALCTKCHTSKSHKKGGFLYDWMINRKKVKEFKGETFMSIVNKGIVNKIREKYPDLIVRPTYGYLTKNSRIILKNEHNGFEKSHHTDAFIIAGGSLQKRTESVNYKCIRRNDRSLSTFKDSKFIDVRDGSTKSGSELNSGRGKRNKNLNTENLKKFRGKKIRNGQNTASKKVYEIKNGTIIKIIENWEGKNKILKKDEIYISGGHTGIDSIYIKNNDGKKISIPERICEPVYHKKGLVQYVK